VSNVEIRTVELTENMVRAIAKQAEAERDRRAKIIHAEAEFQASQTLVNAAKILASIPAAMQLRLSPDTGGDRGRAKLDRRLPHANRHHQTVPGTDREAGQGNRHQWRQYRPKCGENSTKRLTYAGVARKKLVGRL